MDEAINCSLDAELTKKFLLELKDSQSAIRAVAIAWEMIPDHYFESHDFRRTIRAEFIRKGFFLDLSLVKDTSAIGLFRLNCLSYANQIYFLKFQADYRNLGSALPRPVFFNIKIIEFYQ